MEKFMELLRNLGEKIEKLEKEKAGLLAEIERLKGKGEAKAQELENEVTTLRKEVKALENLLNIKETAK
jgi:predicted  nucleic acid-binding Zn-ribbon protein